MLKYLYNFLWGIYIMDKLNYEFSAETGCIIAKTDNHHDFGTGQRITEPEQFYNNDAVLEYLPTINNCHYLNEDNFLNKYIWKFKSAADAKKETSKIVENIEELFNDEIIQNYEIKQIYRPANKYSPETFDTKKSYIHRKLDEMGIKDDIYFVSDIRHTNEFDDLLAIDNENTNRKFYWVQNAQTEFDPMGKTKDLDNKNAENPKFIFCWEKYDPNNYTIYPEWSEKNKEKITDENKEIMFYSNRRIYMAMQPNDKKSKDIYDNYKSSILITYPKSKNYAYADKEMATVSSHLIKSNTNNQEYNNYQNNCNQFKKILLEFYKNNLNHIEHNRIADFNNSNKYLSKRLGDAGEALSCLKNKVIFQKYVNKKVEEFESTNLFAFITWDRVCLANSLIYKVPILVCSLEDSILLFVRKDLLNPKELLDQHYNNNSIEKYIQKITNKFIGNDTLINNYNTFQSNIEKLNNFITNFKMDYNIDNNMTNLDNNLTKIINMYINITDIIIRLNNLNINNDIELSFQGIQKKIIEMFNVRGFDINQDILLSCIQDKEYKYNTITEIVFKNYKDKNISIENYNEIINTDKDNVNNILGDLTNIYTYYNNINDILEYINDKIDSDFKNIIHFYISTFKKSTIISNNDLFNLDYNINNETIKDIMNKAKNKANMFPYNYLCFVDKKQVSFSHDYNEKTGYNAIISIFKLFIINKYNITLYNHFIVQIEILLQKLKECATDKKRNDSLDFLNIINQNISEMGFKKTELSIEMEVPNEKVSVMKSEVPNENVFQIETEIPEKKTQSRKEIYYGLNPENIIEGKRERQTRRGGATYNIMDVNNDKLSQDITMLKEFDLFLKGFMLLLIVIWSEGYMITNDLDSDKLLIKIIYFYLTAFDIDIIGNYQLKQIEKDIKKIIQEYNDGNINFIYDNHYEDVIYNNKFTLNNLNINKCVYNYVNCIDERITEDMKIDVEDFFNLSKNRGFNDILLPPLSNKPVNRNEQSSPIQKTLFPFPEEMNEFINNIFLSGEIFTIINTIHNKIYNLPLSSDKLSNNNLIQNLHNIRTGHSINENKMNIPQQKQLPANVFSFGGKKTRRYNKKISRNYRIKKNKTKRGRNNRKTRKS